MIDSILTEWRFRLESGYPKTKADYAVLRDVILEMTDLTESDADQIVRQAQGITEADDMPGMSLTDPNSETDDFADLLQILKTKNREGQFYELAKYTQKYYTNNMPVLKQITVPFSITDINDNLRDGHYTLENARTNLPLSDYTNPGTAAEAVIFAYMNDVFSTSIQHITTQEKGIDGKDDTGIIFEVKTSTSGNINLNLQTTFFSDDPNKFYIFGFRNGAGYRFNSITPVYIISSQLLRRISLGEEIYSQLSSETRISDILTAQIESGLAKTNFKDQIIAALTNETTAEFTKQFDIGNNVSVVFKIFIQPKKF
jgi:hypothetical protein